MSVLKVMMILLVGSQLAMAEEPASKPSKDKVSYAVGVDMGRSFKRLALDLDVSQLFKGIEDAYRGKPLAISDDEIKTVLNAYQAELKEKQIQAIKAIAESNKKAGAEFLAKNAQKKGVVTTPSGLQYEVLTKGKGDKPKEDQIIKCNFRGTLVDGTEFDSSYKVSKPAVFKVGLVMPGLKEALLMMPVGSKWNIVIPSPLAYGE